jgi:MFS family permease
MKARDIESTFLHWTFLRAVFHRGYTLTSALYFVIVAHLSAAQLLGLVVVISAVYLLADIPLGAWSDTFSRKWPLVIGQACLAACMITTGVVRSFGLLAVTQMLWALGWSFSMGVDVAWVTDELRQPERIARVLTARARRDLIGGAVGMIAFGAFAYFSTLAPAIVGAGIGMAVAAVFVALRFPEDNFVPAPTRGVRASIAVLGRGYVFARGDRAIMSMLVATLIVNGAGVIVWLIPKQLVALGYPNDPVLWYTALMVVASGAGVVALHVVERRTRFLRANYVLACGLGSAGAILLATAPNAVLGSVGVVALVGVAFSVTRAISEIWVNERVSSEVRATVLSFLSQAETVGEAIGSVLLALLARAAGVEPTLIVAGIAIVAAAATLHTVRASSSRSINGRRRLS